MRLASLASAAVCGLALSLPSLGQPSLDARATPPGSEPQTAASPASSAPAPADTGTGGPPPAPDISAPTPPPAPGLPAAGSVSAAPQPEMLPFLHAPPPSSRLHRAAPAPVSDGNGSGAAAGEEAVRWAHEPGTGQSGPASSRASNIDSATTSSEIAPHLAAPNLGPNAGSDGYLFAASAALRKNRTGEAQQALEMAETRLLDRSTPVSTARQPDQDPRVQAVRAALEALGRNDQVGAQNAIQAALRAGG